MFGMNWEVRLERPAKPIPKLLLGDVAAAQDRRYSASGKPRSECLYRGNSHCTRWLHEDSGLIEYEAHRLKDRFVVHEYDIVNRTLHAGHRLAYG